ncbi:hypothetical protein Tco_1065934 [Tanacetum coccineum]
MGFDLVRFYLCPSSIERDTTEGVGIQEANFDTGNHRRDDFTPLETIQRLETVSQITRDALTIPTTTASQDLQTTSERMTHPNI